VVRIWVRATLDYDDERAFEAQLVDRFREQVALWDSVFVMPYRVFRARVRAIAPENLELVEGAVCSSWEEIPEGALVLPCDDDDWFRCSRQRARRSCCRATSRQAVGSRRSRTAACGSCPSA
jgi:hypothetical protein